MEGNGTRFEIRVHGRGGQGVVTAAELLSVAAFDEGRHAQAFPSFGSERSGAPVVAFCRIAHGPIRTREPIAEPDALIVQDPTLLHQVALFEGLRPQGYVLINSGRDLEQLGLGELLDRFRPERLLTVPATEIARRRLGRPLPNAALLGGFAALTGLLRLDSVTAAIRERFPGVMGDRNAEAAEECFAAVERGLEAAHA
jgi:pyruvate ferredoxin oxidoreductase gamma subunit